MKKIIFCFIFILYFCCVSFAQDARVFDLARYDTGAVIIVDVDPCSVFRMKIINLVPTKCYYVNVVKKTFPIESLKYKDEESRMTQDTECVNLAKNLKSVCNSLTKATEEKDVSNYVELLYKSKTEIEYSDCFDEMKNEISLANILLLSTKKDISYGHGLTKGEKLVITIEREDGRKWTVVYDAGKRGEWLTSYGFAFASNVFLQSRIFSLKQITPDSSIAILSDKSRLEGDFAPAIFFSWIPESQKNNNWCISPCGGIGIDLKKPVILGGLSFTYNWNLNFIVGILFRWDDRKSDKFVEFQTIKAGDVEKLNRETVVFNPFFALSYRFGSNPFLDASEDKK